MSKECKGARDEILTVSWREISPPPGASRSRAARRACVSSSLGLLEPEEDSPKKIPPVWSCGTDFSFFLRLLSFLFPEKQYTNAIVHVEFTCRAVVKRIHRVRDIARTRAQHPETNSHTHTHTLLDTSGTRPHQFSACTDVFRHHFSGFGAELGNVLRSKLPQIYPSIRLGMPSFVTLGRILVLLEPNCPTRSGPETIGATTAETRNPVQSATVETVPRILVKTWLWVRHGCRRTGPSWATPRRQAWSGWATMTLSAWSETSTPVSRNGMHHYLHHYLHLRPLARRGAPWRR